jgi:hypothetical protein
VFLADNRTKEIQRLRAANAQLKQQLSGQRKAQKRTAKKAAQKKGARGAPPQGSGQPAGGWGSRLRRLGRHGPDGLGGGRR